MDDEMIVMRAQDFWELLGEYALPPWTDRDGRQVGSDVDCAPIAEALKARVEALVY